MTVPHSYILYICLLIFCKKGNNSLLSCRSNLHAGLQARQRLTATEQHIKWGGITPACVQYLLSYAN